ncbi:hypothetical protein SAMN04487914_13618 [Arthrobacter sp. ok909]|nr:hypothetical protein SAMN04487914_13618 [Arthrobacter sp. ok909]
MADTIGAGGSHMAALIYGLWPKVRQGWGVTSLESPDRTASMTAAIAVRGPGAAARGRRTDGLPRVTGQCVGANCL